MPQAAAAAATAGTKPDPDDDAPPTIIPTQTLSRLLPAAEYDVHCITLISSSKIHRKVTRMLEHLGHAPRADAGSTAAEEQQQQQQESGAEDTAMPDAATTNKSPDALQVPAQNPVTRKRGQKPCVVTLSAKAPAASKAISVAEIVKRAIALAGDFAAQQNGSTDKEGEEEKKEASGRKKRTAQRAAPALYQYNILASMPPPLVPRPSKRPVARPATAASETDASAAAGKLTRKRKRQPKDEEEPTPAPAAPPTDPLRPHSQSQGQAQAQAKGQDSDSDAYFETAQHKPKSHNHKDDTLEEQPQRQRHNIPILTVVFSRCRVEALRSGYGEQLVYLDDGDGDGGGDG